MRKSKIIVYTILALIAPMLISSCQCSNNKKKDAKEKAHELLTTVPGDAGMVAYINIEKILSTADAKEDLDNLIPAEMLNKMTKKGKKDWKNLKVLLGEDGGLEMSSAIFFVDGEKFVFTMGVSDAKKLKTALEDVSDDVSISKKDGYYQDKKNNLFFTDKQLWVGSDLSLTAVKRYEKMDEKKCFTAKVKNFDEMVNYDSDMFILTDYDKSGDIMAKTSGISDAQMRQYMLVSSVVSGLVSKDMKYTYTDINFNSHEMTMVSHAYNENGKPAQSNMKFKKIDTNAMQSYLANGDIVAAVGLDSQYLNSIADLASGYVAADQMQLYRILANDIDGTAGVSWMHLGVKEYCGFVSCQSESSATELMELADFAGIKYDVPINSSGNIIKFGTEDASYSRLSADVAGMFEGYNMAIYFSSAYLPSLDYCLITVDTDKIESRLVVKCKSGKTFGNLFKELDTILSK